MKLYHESHCVNRSSIEKHGLFLNPAQGEAVASITGGFFFSSKLPEEASEQIDVWELDASGLPTQIDDTDTPLDPEDTWWVVYGLSVIEPWRLRLALPATAPCPAGFRCGGA